jgi:NADP-dependent 3-hydroxy acid dehydrogenase YdfG
VTPERRRAASAALTGRVAVVTGAGRGIGRATATALVQAGAAVVLLARTRPEVEAVAAASTAAGHRALALRCDVRDARSVRNAVAAAVRRLGGIDILINNAGAFRIAALADTDEALWNSIVDTNLKGTYLMTRAALPHLLRRRGHIVNVVSLAARVVFPGNAAYAAAKAGQLAFTNVIREEFRAQGLRVTAIVPGAVDTPLWDAVPGKWERARMLRPEAVAQAVVTACTLPRGAVAEEIVLTPG